MKIASTLLFILCLLGSNLRGQSAQISGKAGKLKTHFGGQYVITVGSTEVVLLVEKSQGEERIKVNPEFLDFLVKKNGKMELNPKYIGKELDVTFSVNGKGWKCIQNIKLHTS